MECSKVSKSKIEFEITNMGSVEGEEVAQVYIKPIDSKIFRAAKELKGFDKVELATNSNDQLFLEHSEKIIQDNFENVSFDVSE